MSDNVVQGPLEWADHARRSAGTGLNEGGDGGGGGTLPPNFDVYGWRLDQHDKQFDRTDAKLDSLQRAVDEIRLTLAGLPTRRDATNQTYIMAGIFIATAVTAIGIFIAASGNQLSAFQAGLSALQTHATVTPATK